MIYWQIASCTISLQAPPPIVAAATPLIALYPSIPPQKGCNICFTATPTGKKHWKVCCNNELLWEDDDIGNIIAALELALYQRVVEAIASTLISIHASAMAIKGEAIVCAGASGAGKSSLCTQALLTGANYCSDEFALLDANGNIHPFSRPLQWEHIKHPAFSHHTMIQSRLFNRGEYQFKQPDGSVKISQLWLPQQLQHTAIPLKIIILPQFIVGSTTSIMPMTRSTAILKLASLLHHRNSIQHNIQTLHQRIPTTCKLYTLRFGNVADAWQQVLELL